MMPELHSYHLDDDPHLRSCNVLLKAIPSGSRDEESRGISDATRLTNFYGRGRHPVVRYVREKPRPDYARASSDEYELELIEDAT
jgi:hypothetical protein